jgi:hypothetical protein
MHVRMYVNAPSSYIFINTVWFVIKTYSYPDQCIVFCTLHTVMLNVYLFILFQYSKINLKNNTQTATDVRVLEQGLIRSSFCETVLYGLYTLSCMALKMEAACTFETLVTLSTSTVWKHRSWINFNLEWPWKSKSSSFPQISNMEHSNF